MTGSQEHGGVVRQGTLACVIYKKKEYCGALSVLNVQGSTKKLGTALLCVERKSINFLSFFFSYNFHVFFIVEVFVKCFLVEVSF